MSQSRKRQRQIEAQGHSEEWRIGNTTTTVTHLLDSNQQSLGRVVETSTATFLKEAPTLTRASASNTPSSSSSSSSSSNYYSASSSFIPSHLRVSNTWNNIHKMPTIEEQKNEMKINVFNEDNQPVLTASRPLNSPKGR